MKKVVPIIGIAAVVAITALSFVSKHKKENGAV